MILIKDRHASGECIITSMLPSGKYDTYKGSTPVEPHSEHNPNISGGNMILIKDRHTVFFLN